MEEKAKPEADQNRIDEYNKEFTRLTDSKTEELKAKHDRTANIYKKAQCGLLTVETSVVVYNAIKHDIKQIDSIKHKAS